MKNILLCSSNPILTKNLYAILRDAGFTVESIEHPAFAVQSVMTKKFNAVIIDSEPFGLSAEDAVEIIRTVAPALPVLFVGEDAHGAMPAAERPLDLEELKRTIRTIAVNG